MSNTIRTSRIAGLFYLIVAITGFFTSDIWNRLIVKGDIVATIANISANEFLFRISLISNILMTLGWVMLALFLYKLFLRLNKINAITMLSLVVLGSAMTLLSTLTKTTALSLMTDNGIALYTDTNQLNNLISILLDLSYSGLMYAYIFFGLWLFPLGILIYKSNFSPNYVRLIISILLIVAGLGYLLDSLAFLFDWSLEIKITQFTFYGEVLLLVWLLIKGIKIKGQNAIENTDSKIN